MRIRLSCIAVLGLFSALVFSVLDSAILKWSCLSMGLRASAVFAGLVLAVFFTHGKTYHESSRFMIGFRPLISGGCFSSGYRFRKRIR